MEGPHVGVEWRDHQVIPASHLQVTPTWTRLPGRDRRPCGKKTSHPTVLWLNSRPTASMSIIKLLFYATISVMVCHPARMTGTPCLSQVSAYPEHHPVPGPMLDIVAMQTVTPFLPICRDQTCGQMCYITMWNGGPRGRAQCCESIGLGVRRIGELGRRPLDGENPRRHLKEMTLTWV